MPLNRPLAAVLGAGAAALALGAGVLGAGPARAAAALPCDGASDQVFLPWGDQAQYQLAPGGDFESADNGWSYDGGARLVADGDDLLHRGPDASSLELQGAASSTSPPVCVTDDSPTFRFSANVVAGWKSNTPNLRVQVLYRSTRNSPWSVKSYDYIAPRGNSQATKKFSMASGQFGLDPNDAYDYTQIEYRVIPLNGATVRVDDFYVDPRLR